MADSKHFDFSRREFIVGAGAVMMASVLASQATPAPAVAATSADSGVKAAKTDSLQMNILFQGFPGRLTDGYMLWSSIVYIHSGGKHIVFDTGGAGRRVTLVPVLEKVCGVKADQIDVLVMSHFHDDHIYNYDLFPKAELLLHEAEEAHASKGTDPWAPLPFFEAVKKTGRLTLVKEGYTVAPGAAILHTPGHTPGCMSLLLQSDSMPTTVLAGDAIKNITELASGRVAMSLDQDATIRSIAKVRDIAKHVVPGHDRTLAVEKGVIRAVGETRQTVVIPAGCLEAGKAVEMPLVLPVTELNITG